MTGQELTVVDFRFGPLCPKYGHEGPGPAGAM
jgi:hypothetical protein